MGSYFCAAHYIHYKINFRMRKFFLLVLLFQSIIAFSQKSIIDKAFNAYNAKEYNKAINYYNQILKNGSYSSALYYNLANSYYNVDSLGKAMLYYEKALKLNPENKDIKHNIFLTERKLDSEIADLPDFFLIKWWTNFSNFFSLNIWTVLIYFFALIVVLSLFVFWFKNDKKLKAFSKITAIVSFVLFIIALLAAMNVYNRIYHNNNAILMSPDSLYIAPDSRSEMIYYLQPGEKMKIVDSLKNWYNIELRNKEKAWIEKDNLSRI